MQYVSEVKANTPEAGKTTLKLVKIGATGGTAHAHAAGAIVALAHSIEVYGSDFTGFKDTGGAVSAEDPEVLTRARVHDNVVFGLLAPTTLKEPGASENIGLVTGEAAAGRKGIVSGEGGGTVTKVAISKDGVNFVEVTTSAVGFPAQSGDFWKPTYSAYPGAGFKFIPDRA